MLLVCVAAATDEHRCFDRTVTVSEGKVPAHLETLEHLSWSDGVVAAGRSPLWDLAVNQSRWTRWSSGQMPCLLHLPSV